MNFTFATGFIIGSVRLTVFVSAMCTIADSKSLWYRRGVEKISPKYFVFSLINDFSAPRASFVVHNTSKALLAEFIISFSLSFVKDDGTKAAFDSFIDRFHFFLDKLRSLYYNK